MICPTSFAIGAVFGLIIGALVCVVIGVFGLAYTDEKRGETSDREARWRFGDARPRNGGGMVEHELPTVPRPTLSLLPTGTRIEPDRPWRQK